MPEGLVGNRLAFVQIACALRVQVLDFVRTLHGTGWQELPVFVGDLVVNEIAHVHQYVRYFCKRSGSVGENKGVRRPPRPPPRYNGGLPAPGNTHSATMTSLNSVPPLQRYSE